MVVRVSNDYSNGVSILDLDVGDALPYYRRLEYEIRNPGQR